MSAETELAIVIIDIQPTVWPACPTCDTAWVYRKAQSLSEGTIWLWLRDCKHKSHPVCAGPAAHLTNRDADE